MAGSVDHIGGSRVYGEQGWTQSSATREVGASSAPAERSVASILGNGALNLVGGVLAGGGMMAGSMMWRGLKDTGVMGPGLDKVGRSPFGPIGWLGAAIVGATLIGVTTSVVGDLRDRSEGPFPRA